MSSVTDANPGLSDVLRSTARMRPAGSGVRRRLPAAVAAFVLCGAQAVWAAGLPVEVGRLQGEAAVVQEQAGGALAAGQAPSDGTRVHTGADGRAELLMQGVPSVVVGADTQLLLHSGEGQVLRARLGQGRLHVDTRAKPGKARRDLRLNVGDMRLQVAGGEVWIEQTDEQTQVCSISGTAELQLDGRHDRLDFPGQCVRKAGVETAWTLVPLDVLSARVAEVALAAPAAVIEEAPTVLAAVPAANPVAAAVPVPAPTPISAPVESVPAAPVVEASLPAALAPPDVAPAVEGIAVPDPATLEVAELPELPPLPAAAVPVSPPVADGPDASATGSATASGTLMETLGEAERIAEARATEVAPPMITAPSAVSTAAREVRAPATDPEVVEAAAAEAAVAAQPAGPAVGAAGETLDDGRRWSVVLASMSTPEAAQEEIQRLRKLGLRAETREYRVGERQGYRVGLGRYDTREQADAALAKLHKRHPKLPGWVAKY